MVSMSEVQRGVDEAFAITGRGHAPWPDPHPDRSPSDDQYSRLTDPGKYRIVGARADAWIDTLVALGLGHAERDLPADRIRWAEAPGVEISRITRLRPTSEGSLELIVARTRIGEVPDAGVALGAGDPAALVDLHPDCGCDACDSGSQAELDVLDEHFTSVITGTFRRLTRGSMQITVIEPPGWRARGLTGRRRVAAILADPAGWHEVSGRPWLGGAADSG